MSSLAQVQCTNNCIFLFLLLFVISHFKFPPHICSSQLNKKMGHSVLVVVVLPTKTHEFLCIFFRDFLMFDGGGQEPLIIIIVLVHVSWKCEYWYMYHVRVMSVKGKVIK